MAITAKLNTYLAKKFFKLINSFANNDAKDISRTRRRLATLDTAQFVEEHMFSTPTFVNRYDLLLFALEKVTAPGLFLEFGVFKGKTINMMAEKMPTSQIYGFDSFEGLPEDWRHDFKKGAFAMNELPPVKSNVKLIKGWFNETLPPFVKEHPEPCAFIHVDCDLYSSTKTIFDTLNNQIVSGTILLFDEFFNYPGWRQGEYKALMELCEQRNFKIEYLGYCDKEEQVAIRLV